MQPTIELRVYKDTTQEASSMFNRTGYSAPSPFIKKGKDGDAQPINKPTADSTPRFPIKVIDFEENLYQSNFINYIKENNFYKFY